MKAEATLGAATANWQASCTSKQALKAAFDEREKELAQAEADQSAWLADSTRLARGERSRQTVEAPGSERRLATEQGHP